MSNQAGVIAALVLMFDKLNHGWMFAGAAIAAEGFGLSCQDSLERGEDMVIVSVLYPSLQGSRFDHAYYRERHLPFVRKLLEPYGMRSLTYFIPAGEEGQVPFRLIAELRFDSMALTDAALRAHGPATQADIANFTDTIPVIAIGEEIVA